MYIYIYICTSAPICAVNFGTLAQHCSTLFVVVVAPYVNIGNSEVLQNYIVIKAKIIKEIYGNINNVAVCMIR